MTENLNFKTVYYKDNSNLQSLSITHDRFQSSKKTKGTIRMVQGAAGLAVQGGGTASLLYFTLQGRGDKPEGREHQSLGHGHAIRTARDLLL